MDLPPFIHARLVNLERRYDAAIPSHMRRHVQFPDGTETPEQIAEAVEYYTEQARSEWLKVDAMTMNAGHPSMSSFERRLAQERLSGQQNRWRGMVNLRDAWVEARAQHRIAAE